jgi:hypothetical protein
MNGGFTVTESQKAKKVVRADTWLAVDVAAGVGIGVAFGAVFRNIALGILIGAALGAAFWAIRQARS